MPDRGRVPIVPRKAWNEPTDRVREYKLPLLQELHDARGGADGLGQRCQVEDRIRQHRPAFRGNHPVPEGCMEQHVIATPHKRDGPRGLSVIHGFPHG